MTASSSTVRFVSGGQACTLGSRSTFVGTILALTSITLATGVTLDGRATTPGATLPATDSPPATVTPASGSTLILLVGLFALSFAVVLVTSRRSPRATRNR